MYQSMMSRNLDINQSCKNKEVKIKELEKEINRLKNYTQTPEKKKK